LPQDNGYNHGASSLSHSVSFPNSCCWLVC
jgi:hypothetical protein